MRHSRRTAYGYASTPSPDSTYRAKIIEVSKGTTRNNLSYLLTAILPNEGGKLLAGMSGKAILDTPQAESAAGFCISQAALCHRPSTAIMYGWLILPHRKSAAVK